VSDELERVWNEGGRGIIEVLSSQFTGEIEETHKILSQDIRWRKF
jgi:hypothetical protein